VNVFIQFENQPLAFRQPKSIISCTEPASFAACFQDIEAALQRGYYVAGFFSYEAGYCFEEKLRQNNTADFPLMYLGVYDAPDRRAPVAKKPHSPGTLTNPRLNISYDNYSANIRTIRDYIAKGDVYQITYCIKLLFDFHGDPFSFFNTLLRQQPVPYPAYIETDQFRILSLSPEMFIKKTSAHVATKPMKGTWPRGRNMLSDLTARLRFQYDTKNRAENVMIADLLRNDLGRLGVNIRAPKLFEVAKYRTLYQMTSTVTGQLDQNVALYELFASLFPSGSVTGAPKISAMQIIRELEPEPRHIYTGAIGYIAPNKDLFFNIPIRTLLLRGDSGEGEMGVGGGIVWDSTPQGEWAEGLLKAEFLKEKPRNGLGF
jgi:para-aminobenzoate synthetase / 4-amino-4-deoxychorismate lyase